MTHLRKTASVAPSTITRVSTGDVPTAARRAPRRAPVDPSANRPTPGPQRSYTRVNPDVWLLAMARADGDALRIQVFGPEEVIVHNSRHWRKRK